MLRMIRSSSTGSLRQSMLSTVRPSRSTVIRSATRATSFNLCEIRIEAMPCSRNATRRSSSAALSVSLRLGGRLVQDQQAHPLGERLRDLDQLLLADTEIGDQRIRLLAQADLGQQFSRAPVHLVTVDDAERAWGDGTGRCSPRSTSAGSGPAPGG